MATELALVSPTAGIGPIPRVSDLLQTAGLLHFHGPAIRQSLRPTLIEAPRRKEQFQRKIAGSALLNNVYNGESL